MGQHQVSDLINTPDRRGIRVPMGPDDPVMVLHLTDELAIAALYLDGQLLELQEASIAGRGPGISAVALRSVRFSELHRAAERQLIERRHEADERRLADLLADLRDAHD